MKGFLWIILFQTAADAPPSYSWNYFIKCSNFKHLIWSESALKNAPINQTRNKLQWHVCIWHLFNSNYNIYCNNLFYAVDIREHITEYQLSKTVFKQETADFYDLGIFPGGFQHHLGFLGISFWVFYQKYHSTGYSIKPAGLLDLYLLMVSSFVEKVDWVCFVWASRSVNFSAGTIWRTLFKLQ